MTHLTINIPALSKASVDRAEDLRESVRLHAAWSTARMLRVAPNGEFVTMIGRDGLHLVTELAAGRDSAPPADAVLLGSFGGVDYWAMVDDVAANLIDGAVEGLSTVRVAGPLLPDGEAVLATTAVALLGWHRGAGFCSRCGSRTEPDLSGHSRICSSGHQEFPRLDPAVIVLVHDDADHAVLARQPSWAPGRFSVLAGFAEAGESLEETVAREIGEEVGLAVDDVEYLGSQPWPFPRSLMIAFSARAPHGATLRPRPGEIAEARWFSRSELAAVLHDANNDAKNDANTGSVGGRSTISGITLPGPVSIARRMVEAFVNAS
ncbi:MAG: NAD(+) diphosphatase [Nakamurella sp.]